LNAMSATVESTMSPAEFRALRERLGVSQARLAEMLGMRGAVQISRYETGAVMIPEGRARHLQLLAENAGPPRRPSKKKR